jgi:predicted lipoprotein with Yx(FWY)xxD motif
MKMIRLRTHALEMVLLLIVLVACSSSVRAQVAQAAAALNGTVRDESGAVVPGASVTLRTLDQRKMSLKACTRKSQVRRYKAVSDEIATPRTAVRTIVRLSEIAPNRYELYGKTPYLTCEDHSEVVPSLNVPLSAEQESVKANHPVSEHKQYVKNQQSPTTSSPV